LSAIFISPFKYRGGNCYPFHFTLQLSIRLAGRKACFFERYHLKGKVHVMLNDEVIPFHIAISESRMKAFLGKRLAN